MRSNDYSEYKAREFCNDVHCPVQETLNNLKDKAEAYELIRQTCRTACRYSTWQFHHWLTEKGYIILRNSKLENNENTVLVKLDKKLTDWIDQQVKEKRFRDKNQLIEKAIDQFKSNAEGKA